MTLEPAMRTHSPPGPPRLPWFWIVRGVILGLVGWGVITLHAYLSNPNRQPLVQHITLISPPDRPAPPPPPPQQPEQKAPDLHPETARADVLVEGPPGPRDAGPRQIDDNLGVAADDEAGGDSFGLVSKPGGREITMVGHGGGGGDGEAAQTRVQERVVANVAALNYGGALKHSLEGALNTRHDLRQKVYRAVVDLMIGADGRVVSAQFVETTGDADLDEHLREALVATTVLAPPRGVRQPIRVAVNSKSLSESGSAP